MNITMTTTGRRTGEQRTVKLYGWPDGEDIVVVGSRGGSPKHPAWVHNLRAEPQAVVRIGKKERGVRAREVVRPERDRLWALVCEAFPLYGSYQERTSRLIPLFVLEGAADGGG